MYRTVILLAKGIISTKTKKLRLTIEYQSQKMANVANNIMNLSILCRPFRYHEARDFSNRLASKYLIEKLFM